MTVATSDPRDAHSGHSGAAERAHVDEIVIRGASEHNLRQLDVRIPRDKLVVITGLSGSGKSSLAFDTLYAEGQRRYVESLSAYARQFLDQMTKPDVESIDGLSPAISIEQRTVGRNPRSTVGTATEIYDYLRLLYARAGKPHCHECGLPIASQTPQQMAERVQSLSEGTRIEILAPIVRGRRGQYKQELDLLRRQGYVRVRIDGVMQELDSPLELDRGKRHDVDVVIDRLRVKAGIGGRLTESIATALEKSDGLLLVLVEGEPGQEEGQEEGRETQREWLFSSANSCAACGVSFPELAPRLFSFNSPAGACGTCSGLGILSELDPTLVVPNRELSLAAEPIEPWKTGASGGTRAWYRRVLAALAHHFSLSLETPWQDLPELVQNTLLRGSGEEPIALEISHGKQPTTLRWRGILDELERSDAARESVRSPLDRYRSARTCAECDGTRLRLEARHVFLAGAAIHELAHMSCRELRAFLLHIELDARERLIAERVLLEIGERLSFLCDVGLDYLTLDRNTTSLSGGEGQRIRLATQIGSSLMGVLYVLDEPSIGLHARDNQRLLASLARLRDMGNSVIVVEHDEETIRASDYVIDMGPGAGVHGGTIVATGTAADLAADPRSLTGDYLAGRRHIPRPSERREPTRGEIVLAGCCENNLKNVTLRVPLGVLSVVTGVSGSGKSTLVNDTLQRALAAELHGALDRPGAFEEIAGVSLIDKVINVDQTPIGRSPRSNPATYTSIFGEIRKIFSQVPEARVRGYGVGRFSFNVKGGRCEACRGDGLIRVEMSFLPDLFVVCEECGGRRYNRETLQIAYKGKTIADLLDTSIDDAAIFLENTPALRRPLQSLQEVGLGYLRLGQPATTLSGGEAQRIKLARELGKRSTGRTLYLLDEPTTGLHFADVAKLLELLHRLVERGNTVVVIEHHLDVVNSADHVIDLGPEGGAAGGEIVATGTPEEVSRAPRSHTGAALAAHRRVRASSAQSSALSSALSSAPASAGLRP